MYACRSMFSSTFSADRDVKELFKRIGPVVKLQLKYDRAGRSEGTAFVTYETKQDAAEAIRQFDGANANGTALETLICKDQS